MKNRDTVDIGNINNLGMVLYQIDAGDVSIGIRGRRIWGLKWGGVLVPQEGWG